MVIYKEGAEKEVTQETRGTIKSPRRTHSCSWSVGCVGLSSLLAGSPSLTLIYSSRADQVVLVLCLLGDLWGVRDGIKCT